MPTETSPPAIPDSLPPIFLIGFMGSGKTTVGSALASRVGGRFIDLDERISTEAGCTIPEIFEAEGEEGFRRREHAVLKEICRRLELERGTPVGEIPTIIALGGGAFAQTVNRDLINGTGTSVWLDAPFDVLLSRLVGGFNRPLFRNAAQAQKLYNERHPLYAVADHRIEIRNQRPEALAGEILRILAEAKKA
jgi:shikimate kinase